ncbi:MAG TPA: ABC transporter permease [Pyrinomonadaceae bacterium]|nr:ABC transporter permease [Pyrinomonadaceae bacterium]
MTTFLQDFRYGARLLRKQPGFTVVAVVTLALGIGVNTAIFSVVHGILLRPLPFKDPDQLVMVWNRGAEAAGGDRTPLAYADLLDWRAQNRSFDQIGALQYAPLNYTGGDSPIQLRGVNVTSNFLTVLGVGVQLGRDFQISDEQVGAPQTVILSDGFWRSHFAADPQIVGRSISLNGANANIIGVMPPNLSFPNPEIQLWRALQLEQPTRRGPYFLRGIARLKPGVTTVQAKAESSAMTSSFEKTPFKFNVLRVNDFIVGEVRPALIALLVSVILVLLIAAVNVANLTLVRSASRLKEISIRSALGASRGRIIRRLLTESFLVAILGGTAGIICAFWGVSVLIKFAPADLPRVDQIKIDGVVLAWTSGVTLLSAVIFGLVPAWQGSRLNLTEVLRDGGRTTSESPGKRRGRGVLVIAELSLAVVLVTGAGLLLKSLWRMRQVDLGINSASVLTMNYTLRGQRYREESTVREFEKNLVDQVRVLPGVRVAAISNSLPPDETDFSSGFYIEGQPTKDHADIAFFTLVSPDYFKALEIPIRRGRAFTETDNVNAPAVAIINETFQRSFFGAEDPIGKRINVGSPDDPAWLQITGVAGDVKYNGLTEGVQPAIYQPVAQNPPYGAALIIKCDLKDPRGLIGAVRNELKRLDPDLPMTNVATMDDRVSTAVAQPRFRTTLIGSFALVALILACVGIYGVISYSVTQRTREIGIRMALGARGKDVLRLIVKQAFVMAAVGVALGLTVSFALASLMVKLLFNVGPRDPLTFIATALLLATMAIVAAYIPARRASRVDPLVALRSE